MLRKLVVVAVFALALTAVSASAATKPSFVDPTASLSGRGQIALGQLDYLGPFVRVSAGKTAARSVRLGDESNLQDNVVVDARGGRVRIGDQAILAHGAAADHGAMIGVGGRCPHEAQHCPSFVSFNALVDGGTVERDAMVSALARVGHGVVIPSGLKVLPGKNVTSQAEVAADTVPVTEADREFMHGVVHVNVEFAHGYTELGHDGKSNLRGINYNPGGSAFNPKRSLPTLAGKKTRDPKFRSRIIGDVRLADPLSKLDHVIGQRISLRADEGEPFTVGTIDKMSSGTVFHALEHTSIRLGNDGTYGAHSIMHGGPTDFAGGVEDETRTGDGFTLGARAVFFRSRSGSNVTIGARSLVQNSDLPDGTVVPPRSVIIDGASAGVVEW